VSRADAIAFGLRRALTQAEEQGWPPVGVPRGLAPGRARKEALGGRGASGRRHGHGAERGGGTARVGGACEVVATANDFRRIGRRRVTEKGLPSAKRRRLGGDGAGTGQ
jgi:hypothetical protein